MEYGVVTNNKFDLFFDECDDPLEILKQKEEEAKQSKVAKVNATKNGKNTSAKITGTSKPTKGNAKVSQSAKSSESKPSFSNQESLKKEISEKPPRFAGKQNEGNKGLNSGLEGDGQQRRDNTTKINEFRDRMVAGESRGENFRGRGGFRRGGRGGGRGGTEGGFDRFGKREFDRHSGSEKSGMKAVDKRDGGGAHNWGNIKDDIEEQLKAVDISAEGEKPEVNVESQTGNEGETGVEESTGPPPEPEEKQMTLDEWKNMQEEKKVKASFNIRQANEGCNNPAWKKYYQLKKKSDEEEEEEEEEEYEEEDDTPTKKKVVNINITFNDTGRRGGAGAGGGRGRGNRGGRGGFGARRGGVTTTTGGGANKMAQAPNVDDESDFPSLS